jgi:UDP-3-O-[3-hydroxymyristoyl] glucosamine N-acyltransferase
VTAASAYTLYELSQLLGLELSGAPEVQITGIATLEKAEPGQLSFYHNPLYHPDLLRTRASAVILRAEDAPSCPAACLLSPNPYAAYAMVSSLFIRPERSEQGVHGSAVVDPSASLPADVMLGPHVVVGAGTSIEADVQIGANTVIGKNCRIGAGTRIHANVTLYDDVSIGCRAIVHSGAVLGSDGFGFAPAGERYLKIAQLGGVRIGDDVEIGAATTIDRGALDDTVIEDGVKIDNQVQIAHNVRVGANTILCGCSAIAGSSVIGKNCIIAGAVGIINHVTLCDGVTVTAMSLVNRSITEPGVYSSGTGLSDSSSWKKNIVRFRQLDEIWRRLVRLERK